ncbi:hypothetical protein RND71_002619 [Anisodus tanguticus]|uniref:Uncharacterized protein n=1 Tax=Anisodus tanguticus TaxID=243964 RepID=A0AAE1T2U4_9SOLA|nr:hypothetical protein RND71_002619 [Anisodus tanguticus]
MDKLHWGNRKRLRCFKVKDSTSNGKSDGGNLVVKKKITSRVVDNNKDSSLLPPMFPLIVLTDGVGRDFMDDALDMGVNRSNANEHRKTSASSPEKEDRCYTTRGSVGVDDSSKLFMDTREEKKRMVWPKLLITLSSKEKEEDFMAMKGCKLPQRPKKRAKLIQRTILLVQPGTWLQDLCQERYEVREKKTSKKKPRGLKAMGSMESDSE